MIVLLCLAVTFLLPPAVARLFAGPIRRFWAGTATWKMTWTYRLRWLAGLSVVAFFPAAFVDGTATHQQAMGPVLSVVTFGFWLAVAAVAFTGALVVEAVEDDRRFKGHESSATHRWVMPARSAVGATVAVEVATLAGVFAVVYDVDSHSRATGAAAMAVGQAQAAVLMVLIAGMVVLTVIVGGVQTYRRRHVPWVHDPSSTDEPLATGAAPITDRYYF